MGEKKRLEQWRDEVKQKAIDMRVRGQENESLKDQLRHFDGKHKDLVDKCRDLEMEVLDKNAEIGEIKRELDGALYDLVESERDKKSLEIRMKRLLDKKGKFLNSVTKNNESTIAVSSEDEHETSTACNFNTPTKTINNNNYST